MKPWLYRFVPMASCLPERLLRWLDYHAPVARQPECFNWSFWTDASYLRWARNDAKTPQADPGPFFP